MPLLPLYFVRIFHAIQFYLIIWYPFYFCKSVDSIFQFIVI